MSLQQMYVCKNINVSHLIYLTLPGAQFSPIDNNGTFNFVTLGVCRKISEILYQH